jgi:hypothetical protein
MARLGTPREVADACAFLASELASYTTAQEFFVTGFRFVDQLPGFGGGLVHFPVAGDDGFAHGSSFVRKTDIRVAAALRISVF